MELDWMYQQAASHWKQQHGISMEAAAADEITSGKLTSVGIIWEAATAASAEIFFQEQQH